MDRFKEFYEKKGWIFRIFFIFFIALWINFYILPDLKISSDNLQRFTENNETYLNREEGSFDLKQEDLNSGNLNTIFWKLIYLGNNEDKICFEKNLSNSNSFSASYNNGEFFNVTNKKCFNIPNKEEKITFQVSYGFNFSIPYNLSSPLPRIVDKSECIWILSNNTCITQEGIKNAVSFVITTAPTGEVYLTSNPIHKFIKFIFIFFSTGALLWAFSRTIKIIKEGFLK